MELSDFVKRAQNILLKEPEGEAPEGLIKAAVLVPVAQIGGAACLGFIRRSTLGSHPGHIAFPGGKMEPGESPVQAALREANEEIGLDERIVKVIGCLPLMNTVSTGYSVWPVVGALESEPVIKTADGEVDEFFWIPADYFCNGANLARRNEILPGEKSPRISFHYNGNEIWGLTFRIVRNLTPPAMCAGIGVK